MSTPYRLGENAKLYYSATPVTSTTYTIPTTSIDNVKDVKVSCKNDTPEYTTRANGGVKQYASSLSDYAVTFLIKVPGDGVTDTAYAALQTAYTTKAEIAVFPLSDKTAAAGEEGPGGNWIVSSWENDQKNGDVQMMSVELKPSSFNAYYIGT